MIAAKGSNEKPAGQHRAIATGLFIVVAVLAAAAVAYVGVGKSGGISSLTAFEHGAQSAMLACSVLLLALAVLILVYGIRLYRGKYASRGASHDRS